MSPLYRERLERCIGVGESTCVCVCYFPQLNMCNSLEPFLCMYLHTYMLIKHKYRRFWEERLSTDTTYA